MAAVGATWTIALVAVHLFRRPGKGSKQMLEWRPRLTALLVVVVLVATAFVTGFAMDLNWEWI
jgi:hypothetical protein